MDNVEMICGTMAWVIGTEAETAMNEQTFTVSTQDDWIARKIYEKTGMVPPTYENVDPCRSVWRDQALDRVQQCGKVLDKLATEIGYLSVEKRYIQYPYYSRTEVKCFVPPKQFGLEKMSSPLEWRLNAPGRTITVFAGLGFVETIPVKQSDYEAVKETLPLYRDQYWKINIERYKQWCRNYGLYENGTFDRGFFNMKWRPDSGVLVGSPAVKEILRTPEEKVYFDKVSSKMLQVTAQMMWSFWDWFKLECQGLPSDRFLNEHGVFGPGQYREEVQKL